MWGVHFYNDEDTNHYGLENYHERKPYNVHTVPTEIDRLCGKWSELRDAREKEITNIKRNEQE